MTDAACSQSPVMSNTLPSSVEDMVSSSAIVILTWNQREQTLRCLRSIAGTGYSMQRVVLWDNGSVDATDEAVLDEFPEVIFHRHPTNQGVASGRNAAALLASRRLSPSYLMFLDNDMVVTDGFFEALCEPFLSNPELAQAVSKIKFFGEPERIHSAGGQVVNFSLGIKSGIGFGEIDRGQYDELKSCLPSGGATLVNASIFRELGGFDAIFDPFGAEDLDYSLRVRAAGHDAIYVPQSVVYHDYRRKSGAGSDGDTYLASRVRHWIILLRRHASMPEQVVFFLGGAIIGLVKVSWRQFRLGNAAALKGIPNGVKQYTDDLPRKERVRQDASDVGIEAD